MFGGRLDLLFYNHEPVFYNSATRLSLENNLKRYNERLSSKAMPEAERTQLRKAKEEAERTLNQLRGKNQFMNRVISLHEQMKDDPEIKKSVEAYKAQTQTTETPTTPK
jgi:phosphoenolpyruvate-protein kinase (PTS system EI component)